MGFACGFGLGMALLLFRCEFAALFLGCFHVSFVSCWLGLVVYFGCLLWVYFICCRYSWLIVVITLITCLLFLGALFIIVGGYDLLGWLECCD